MTPRYPPIFENVAALSKIGGYLGVIQLLKEMESVQCFLEAVEYANKEMGVYSSIVANSVASAVEGFYGDYHKTIRTDGSELWINPIMPMYWCFDLNKVMQLNQYHHLIGDTITSGDIHLILHEFQSKLKELKPYQQIPI